MMNEIPSTPAPSRSSNPLTIVLLLSGAFLVLFIVISAVIFFARSPHGKGPVVSGGLFGGGAVGIVELNGIIMDSKKTLKKLQTMEESPSVAAVVLRLNSPGGAVAPSQEIYEAVRKFKKPLVVSMGSMAASGAFYVACGAKKVFANPGTITGSIGVIMEFANLSKLYDWAKIHRYVLKTGKYKDAGAEYREMEPDERALLQGMIQDVLGQFKKAVSDGRHLPLDRVAQVADGRIFSGAQAKAEKLVDELGTVQDAIDEAAKEAHIKGKPKVVYAERPRPRWLDLVLDNTNNDDSSEYDSGETSNQRGLFSTLVGLLNGRPGAGASLEQEITGIAPGIYWLWGGFSR